MSIQTPHPDDTPYTDADVAAIIAAPHLPLFSNMNPFLEARLQNFAAIEVEFHGAEFEEPDSTISVIGSQRTTRGRWTWELAQIFSQCFRRQHGEPFVRFYREASRRLINSEYVHDKGFDLSYLLFKMKQGKPEELSNGTILRTLRQQRKMAEYLRNSKTD
jgi:hypothetical protein